MTNIRKKLDIPFLDHIGERCKEGEEKIEALDTIFQSFSDYEAGDVTFFEETLKHKFEAKPTYSDKGMFEAIFSSQFWKDVYKIFDRGKGIWLLQPLFSGEYTHSALTNVQKGTPQSGEILGNSFSNLPLSFAEGTFSVAHQPDFTTLLTPEAVSILKKANPNMNDKDMIKEMQYRYQLKLSEIFSKKSELLDSIKTSPWKAALALMPQQLRTLIGSESSRELENIKEMFCSELVSRMLIVTFSELSKDLHAELGIEAPVKLFKDVIPSDADPITIHPNKLREYIAPFYKQKPTPPAIQLLVNKKA